MRTGFIILLIAMSVSNVYAQADSLTLQKSILRLEIQLIEQQNKLDDYYKELDKEYRTYKIIKKQFNDKYNIQVRNIDSLKQIIIVNSANIEKTADELGVKIENTHKFTDQSITDFNKTVSQNMLYWIIAVLFIAIFVLIVFILLWKQIFKQKHDFFGNLSKQKHDFLGDLSKQKHDLENKLQNTKKTIEEEGVKLDNKLIEVLETQLKIINNNSSSSSDTEKEVDHTLALKVADEIIRMQTNMSLMDKDIKGLKKLKSAVKRIQDNFSSNGYELVEMLGKHYNEGMKVIVVSSKPDENLKSGEQIISRIIKPQINFNNKMIQSAQIVVSQGE